MLMLSTSPKEVKGELGVNLSSPSSNIRKKQQMKKLNYFGQLLTK